MYLVVLDNDGLVRVDGIYDGLKAIKEFRAILDDNSLGVECFTAIALVADWLTPLIHYTVSDRPLKAMYQITGNRRAFIWDQDKIQEALNVYQELQYNPALVEKDALDRLLSDQLASIETEKDATNKILLFKQLKDIKELQAAWIKENENSNPHSDGPVDKDGYKLTRLEEKKRDKSSFYNVEN